MFLCVSLIHVPLTSHIETAKSLQGITSARMTYSLNIYGRTTAQETGRGALPIFAIESLFHNSMPISILNRELPRAG